MPWHRTTAVFGGSPAGEYKSAQTGWSSPVGISNVVGCSVIVSAAAIDHAASKRGQQGQNRVFPLKIQALALEPGISNDYHLTVISSRNSNDECASGDRDGPPPGLPNGARVILAPLCGLTDAVFRRICLDRGADMVVTEMISSEAMTRGKEHTVRSLKGMDVRQGPLSLQIFGGDPAKMGETAARLSELEPEYVDMNFGCPVRKIVTQNGGSAVLRDLDLLGRICREVVRRSRVPVSAKIRAGWDKSTGDQIKEIARTIEDAGVSMLAVHARTRKQGFKGQANWDLIAQAKDAVGIPVVGNGDVTSADDFFAIHAHSGCDAVMIGRGAIGNPWVFEEIRARLDGVEYEMPTPRERVEVLLDHVAREVAVDGEPYGVITSRKVMSAYVKHLPGARELRGEMMQLTRLEDLEELLRNYIDTTLAGLSQPSPENTSWTSQN
jgi:nifR3 family TIM-barrel protein